MNLLLDTHVWIWAAEDPGKFGPRTLELLSNSQNRIFVSTLSTWEIAQLVATKKIALHGSLELWVEESLAALQCGTLELSHADAAGAYLLPGEFHRDPADRILVSTARTRELKLVTADRRILAYSHVESIDARG